MEDIQHQQIQQSEQIQQNQQELPKPAPSPLLTSLLKSPSQVPNTSILHTAITNRHIPNTNTNPMIASLLNSTTAVPVSINFSVTLLLHLVQNKNYFFKINFNCDNITEYSDQFIWLVLYFLLKVSPGIQQLVSTAIGQNQNNVNNVDDQNLSIDNDILDDAQLTNIKLDDLANSILVQDGPLPEIKKEEVDDIISEIIENAGDIVDDPEQHLQLDGKLYKNHFHML